MVVDAELGAVALHFDQIETALNRRICDANNTADAGAVHGAGARPRAERPVADNVDDVNKAYDFAGDTYDFYAARFGRDSLNGAGLTSTSTVRVLPPARASAPSRTPSGTARRWSTATATPRRRRRRPRADPRRHRLQSRLFYYTQSGAINESMSDVFGELIDLKRRGHRHRRRPLAAGRGPARLGAIRNMKDPTGVRRPRPDDEPDYYRRPDEQDNGGVHTNSGVDNKAASLITDGGTFNGQTVTGLGIDKAAQIYYELETSDAGARLATTPTSRTCLPQACTNLGSARHGITAADCAQVRRR